MKRFMLHLSAFLSLTLISVYSLQAQCTQETLTSFSLAPGAILGDGTEFATGTIQGCIPDGDTHLVVYFNQVQFPASQTVCAGASSSGSGGCVFPGGAGNITVTFSTNGVNYGTTPIDGTILVNAYGQDPLSGSTTILPVGNPQESPAQDPDGPCPTCGAAGNPINVLNGNTYIPQKDYFMPGVGGGLTLTRTWNSLWANMSPPEESGIFGDSWRSNFEERIQNLGGGVVKYWKGNGSSLFYSYDPFSETYVLTAPADDQTTLSVDSGTSAWLITQKDGTQRTFNSAGFLTSIVDRNGNTTTINVDASNQNRIASVVDPSGHTLTFNYTNSTFPRLCTSIQDSVGTFTQYTYDFQGRLTQVLYPDGSQYNFQFTDPNSNTLISLVTDAQGRTIETHSYDSSRRGTLSAQANDSNGNQVNKVTVQYGVPHAYQNTVCDSTGNNCATVQVTNRAQRHYIGFSTGDNSNACSSCSFKEQSSFILDPNGYITNATDANGNVTFYTYDSAGNTASKSVSEYYTSTLDTWSYTYNSFGQVLTVTDPLGTAPGDPNHTTVYAYDGYGDLLSVTTPSPDGSTPASVTYFTPNGLGQITQIQDPLGNKTAITYCTQGQSNCPYGLVYQITDAQNNVTTYGYDGRGNRLSVTDANSNVTSFQYDAMNRVTQITYPTSPSSTVQFHYDSRGRRDFVIDQNSNKTSYAYDDADRVLSVTDAQSPTAGVTTYGYDTENDLTDIWDAKNHHTRFLYFPGAYLYETIFPSGYTESYSWDGNNNLAWKTDRNSNTISYEYDHQNRLIYKGSPAGSYSYTYDPAGRLTQVQGATGTYNFSYDNMNRLTSTSVDYNFDSAGAYSVQYGYDAASNRVSMTDPQNSQTSYGYDTLNRLTSLSYSSQTFGFGYDALSRRTSLTRPNGVNTSYSYDNLSRLLSVVHASGGTTLDGASYTYDNAGNRTSKTDLLANVTSNYTYDNIYQLLQVTQGTSTTESYTYDPVGNRLSSLGLSPYQYNSSNELTSTPSGSYTYDYNGNMKTKPDGTQYTWNAENRLTQVALPGSGGTVAFKYDPFGRRAQKSFTGGSGTTTTNYLYDGRNSLEEVDATGNLLARYVQGPSIDELISELRGSATSFTQVDFLGSTTSLSNSAGALTSTYTYDSFGNLIGSTGTLTNPFQFTGREFDPETGIYNYRFRYYDQNVGRFLNEDPIFLYGGINLYRYADDNPASKVDPLGLDTKVCYYPSNNQPWGHVGFGLPQEGEQGTTGFYPNSWNVFDGPGKVKPDTEHKPTRCKTIPATPNQDQCMLSCRIRRQTNPGNYKGVSRQCTEFVRECLQECGESSGSGNSPFPKDLIDSLP